MRASKRNASGISTADYFCGIAQTGEMTKEGVAQLLRSLPDGTTELMCHPGIRGRSAAEYADAIAGIAANGVGDFDRRGD